MVASIPTAGTLAKVRALFVRTMPFSAIVIKPGDPAAVTGGRNPDGSDSDAVDAGAGERRITVDNCGVTPLGQPVDAEVAEALQGSRPWLLKFPFDTNVDPGDKVEIGDFLYHVIDTNEGKSNAFTLQCVARKLVKSGEE